MSWTWTYKHKEEKIPSLRKALFACRTSLLSCPPEGLPPRTLPLYHLVCFHSVSGHSGCFCEKTFVSKTWISASFTTWGLWPCHSTSRRSWLRAATADLRVLSTVCPSPTPASAVLLLDDARSPLLVLLCPASMIL